MSRAFLSLGSNLGDRLGYLASALRRLRSHPGVRLIAVSGVYETAPQGRADQPDYLNCAACVETELSPSSLLSAIHEAEQALGRIRQERWGPRTIDIDILLYGEEAIDLPGLTVPHPRMWERAFVLVPLAELQPGGEVERRLAALPDQGVRPYLDGASFHRVVQGVE